MTKIDIVSGFLGAGKTTYIQKMLKDVLHNEKVVLIENEFGEIGIDGGFLKDAGIEIKEMNQGCICCSLVGDFGTSLKEVINKYSPERILIEPSGVGKLSDVIKAVCSVESGDLNTEVILNSAVAVVDVSKAKMYIKNFGEFFVNQIEAAGTIILSRTQNVSEAKLEEAIKLIREHNEKATIITTPWDKIDGKKILETIEAGNTLEEELMEEMRKKMEEEHHHHHHHDEDEECECHHHHHHDEDEECECHHHHHHDEDEEECECHHHHEHDENCTCGCHDHEHHHHHANEVFSSIGFETAKKYTKEQVEKILSMLDNTEEYGFILRSKGIIADKDSDDFIYFDYVPEEQNIRSGAADVTGKIVVIGSNINEDAIKALW